MLRAYKTTMLGDVQQVAGFADLSLTEKMVLFPVVALIVVLGVYPQFIFNLTDESVKFLLFQIDQHLATTL
jgi:NADH-quinone oxidoreductase subunit M